ncbi:putative bifunctional diguanylate cyclase/phosphodiesterase [Photobacterium sp.]|uniref:putative bifunctional diguanylate cyclase/phosphodiesterase n=1 Tax=Photobacterium sp. TaxID=660 RepID=UPI00299CD914|nr:EAL domain-containing protein [Photobacterium sp.]MDX1301604.1 EAL domain-containing protein [Photobacterium sp.]
MNKIIKNALQNLYGTELFDKATELVYDKLNPQHCFIGYFDEHKKQVCTLSYRENGRVGKNFSYNLVDTPCKHVQSDRCTCHYPSSVQELFPRDKPRQDLNAEGYLGVPIFAHTNEPVGIVACLFDSTYEHSQEIEEWSCSLSYLLGVELKYSALLSKQKKLMWESGQERWLTIKGREGENDGDGNPTRIAGIQRDATISVETERQLNQAKVVFDNTSECILITDNNNRIISVNHAFECTTGYKQHELLGLSPSVLSSGLHDKDYYQSLWLSLHTKGRWKGEIWNRRKSGEIYPEEISINVIKGVDDSVVNYVAVFRDISHWKKAEEQLIFFAYYDALTGLVNRRSFTQRVETQSKKVKMDDQVFAILFIDMDDFKSINDLYGHDFGDRVLVQIADRLKLIFPDHDNICRYGGDEFSVLLPNVNAEQASELAREVNRSIAEPINIDDIEVNATVSIGISAYPESGLTHNALLKNADYAMYNMKGEGRNGACLYDSQLQTQDILKLQLRDRLKKAIAEQRIYVCYQPIIHTQTGQIVKFEALARWHDDIQGDISPAVFIPIAEKYGLINQLGMLVLHQACQDLKKIHALGYGSICFSINRSVKEFINRGQDECICDVIEQYELPNSSIVIEITETTASKESCYIHDVLARFKKRGIKVALDDFGTGYSSLGAIVDLRPDLIKIDRSFITEIESNTGSLTLVSLILELSHKLGIKVVAEGVETKAQFDLLEGMNCHYIQGFYVSSAKQIDACIDMLMNESTLMPRAI